MPSLLVRLAGRSCFLEEGRRPRDARDEQDVEHALRAFALRADRDDPTRLEAGISVYAVESAAEADDLVTERAAYANLDRDPARVGHEDFVLVPARLVVEAGLVVEAIGDPEGATGRLRTQHQELRLRPGVSNAEVAREELEAALKRLAELLLVELSREGGADLLRRVVKTAIRARIERIAEG
ncbi:MAG: hypothetical protein R3A52_00135 [Polyangiales bacterium]